MSARKRSTSKTRPPRVAEAAARTLTTRRGVAAGSVAQQVSTRAEVPGKDRARPVFKENLMSEPYGRQEGTQREAENRRPLGPEEPANRDLIYRPNPGY